MNRNVGIKVVALWVCMCILLLMLPLEGMAATKSINSVSIRVSSKLEAGSSLPDIEVGSGTASAGLVRVGVSDSAYQVDSAEWADKGNGKVVAGDEPRLIVTLSPTDVSEAYFLSTYKASSVKINGGTFVSARRDGDDLVVTLRVDAVKGQYDPPEDAYWYEQNIGEARWEEPENTSGYYEVQLYRDEKSVHRVPGTSAIRYNFYPYMTEEGDYTFRVRTIPGTSSGTKYGDRSDWIESGELQITDRYVSDGKGQQNQNSTVISGAKEPVGWVKDGAVWSYRFPNGELCRGKWEYIDGLWYYFNVEGIMQTGWQLIDNQYYYLYPSGQMAVGWGQIDSKWYYFLTEEDGTEVTGRMAASGWRLIGPYYYYFNGDGSMQTGWLAVDGKRYYLNTVDNSLLGALFTGWILRDSKTYFADSNGEVVSGWYQIDGNWHYFYPESGEMAVSTSINGFLVNEDGVWQ